MNSVGLPLSRSLAVLADESDDRTMRDLSRRVRSRVESGRHLADALAGEERYVGEMATSLVRVGEAGGRLDAVFVALASEIELHASVRAKLRAALTYPAIVAVVVAALVTTVLVAIVPVFTHLFATLHAPLPLPTRLVVALSHQMASIRGVLFALLLVAASLGAGASRRRGSVRRWIQRIGWRVPVAGTIVREAAMARAAASLGTLLDAGVALVDALVLAADSSQSSILRDALLAAAAAVDNGGTFSEVLARSGVVSSELCSLVAVGEESGDVGGLLLEGAASLRVSLERRIQSLSSILEPLLIVVMGVLIGGVLISLYLPMLTYVRYIPS